MFNVDSILQTGGLLAVGLMIFAESGLLFGIIFPGDTLLLAAGFFAGAGKLPIGWLIIVSVVAAILGDNVGYRIGLRLGPKVFNRKDGLLFRKEYVKRTEEFYERYGGVTIVLARFIAYVRTFAPVVAGVGRMNWFKFAVFNALGGIVWGAGLPLIGYAVGYSYPKADKYFIWFLIISADILILATAAHILRNPNTRKMLKQRLKEEWNHYFKRKK